MAIPVLDTHEFTRRGDSAAGTAPVAELPRLADAVLDPQAVLRWQVVGRSEVGVQGHRTGFLRLRIDGELPQRCVRCLEQVRVRVAIDRAFRLVGSEAQAEREDPDDDTCDVLVGSRHFDLGALVEDEAIMALPVAPRHDTCSMPQIPVIITD
jgi:uncharacterized protein